MRRLPGARGRRERPACEALESRALLSGSTTTAATTHFSLLGSIPTTADHSTSTVPANGDGNPYGVAAVPRGWLVSNFNDSNNQQGAGSTIVRVNRDGTTTPFFTSSKPLGLTAALGVLRAGFVLVGTLPTTDGTSATVQGPGSLLVLDRNGKQVGSIASQAMLDGPWGMAVSDHGDRAEVYVSNVLSGTVTRLSLKVADGRVEFTGATQVASGYATKADPAALEIGPSGLSYNAGTDTLYVASTGDNAVYAIADASAGGRRTGKGAVVDDDAANLQGPVGLVQIANGDLIAANGDAVNAASGGPSTLVEFTPAGRLVDQFTLSDTAGAAFGLAKRGSDQGIVLAAVNDATSTLDVFRDVFTASTKAKTS